MAYWQEYAENREWMKRLSTLKPKEQVTASASWITSYVYYGKWYACSRSFHRPLC